MLPLLYKETGKKKKQNGMRNGLKCPRDYPMHSEPVIGHIINT